MIPMIPILSIVLAGLGGYGLYWYHALNKEDQERADGLAVQYAQQIYQLGLDQLASHQLSHVQRLVKQHFLN